MIHFPYITVAMKREKEKYGTYRPTPTFNYKDGGSHLKVVHIIVFSKKQDLDEDHPLQLLDLDLETCEFVVL